jgi:Fungal specific transcription factor domain
MIVDIVSMAVDIPELDEPTQPGLLRSRWFPLAVSDRALFLVIILLAASHYVSCYKRNDLRLDLLQLRYEAIHSINQALQVETHNQDNNTLNDAIIGAVAKMASYEAMFGTLGGYNTHMHGLLQMVALRGGLVSLGLNGLLRRMVIWIDRNAAFLHGLREAELYFPHDELSPPNPARFLGES